MPHRFFLPPDKLGNDQAVIDGDEAHHLRRVLRLAAGDEVLLFDGVSNEYRAVIESVSANLVNVRVVERLLNTVESPLDITLACALIKGDRFDLVIQKAVELGITALQPLATAHTDVQLNE